MDGIACLNHNVILDLFQGLITHPRYTVSQRITVFRAYEPIPRNPRQKDIV